MSVRRSASLRFLYALPVVWLAARLPVAIGHVEILLNRPSQRIFAQAPVAGTDHRYVEPAGHTPRPSQSPVTFRASPSRAVAYAGGTPLLPSAEQADSPVAAPTTTPDQNIPVPAIDAGRAWQLADAAYVQLRRGKRSKAAVLLREANMSSPNGGWRRDLVSLTSHWHGDAWLLLRDGDRTPLGINAPALGGSQLGMRIGYLPDPLSERPLVIETRLAQPLRDGATQLAAGIGIRPIPMLPLRITAERQIATGRGTRDAWSLRGEGGVNAIKLPGRFRLDAYGEAGIVGARSNDLFADGDVRITRQIFPAIGIGAGLWAATQPGAQRIDIGPAIVGRLQHGRASLSASIDYRVRVAGNARPSSGPALTVASGF